MASLKFQAKFRAKSGAFTLLEMMVTLFIIAALVSLGVPAFQDYALKQAMSAAVNALHSDLLAARSQAIHQDMRVIACPGNQHLGCAGSTDWSNGWIVFGDRNDDREFQPGEALLRHAPGPDKMAIHSSAGRSHFRFFPNGSTPGSNGTISFCGPGGAEKARKLVISNLGRIRRDSAPSIDPSRCL